MKLNRLIVLTTLALNFLSLPSLALVRQVRQCSTPDGQYQITIDDNQGIGPIRTSHFTATVRDANDEIVANYTVAPKFIGSVSFGRGHYQDTLSGGELFDLVGPSTNFHDTSISMTLQSGEHQGEVMNVEALSCSDL